MNKISYDSFCSNVYVSRETYAKLCVFHETLIKWQNSINLISKDSIKNIWERHFLDSANYTDLLRMLRKSLILVLDRFPSDTSYNGQKSSFS